MITYIKVMKGKIKMLNYLPEIKKVFKLISNETDQLEKLSQRVNELYCDEIIKDCSLHKVHKETTERYYIYEVHRDDFDHITDHIHLIQTLILPDMVVMAQTDNKDNYRVLFRKGQL